MARKCEILGTQLKKGIMKGAKVSVLLDREMGAMKTLLNYSQLAWLQHIYLRVVL